MAKTLKKVDITLCCREDGIEFDHASANIILGTTDYADISRNLDIDPLSLTVEQRVTVEAAFIILVGQIKINQDIA